LAARQSRLVRAGALARGVGGGPSPPGRRASDRLPQRASSNRTHAASMQRQQARPRDPCPICARSDASHRSGQPQEVAAHPIPPQPRRAFLCVRQRVAHRSALSIDVTARSPNAPVQPLHIRGGPWRALHACNNRIAAAGAPPTKVAATPRDEQLVGMSLKMPRFRAQVADLRPSVPSFLT
jgi:hypothetical protein